MKYLKLFNESNNKGILKIKSNKYLFSNIYQINYDIYLNTEYIGMCEIRTCFKTDKFNDNNPSEYANVNDKFNKLNDIKKSDFDKYRFVIYLSGFEIEKEYRGNGYGIKAMRLIIDNIKKLLPKNDGIYLSVFKDNYSAIRIYEKLGFKIIKEYERDSILNESEILVMKLK